MSNMFRRLQRVISVPWIVALPHVWLGFHYSSQRPVACCASEDLCYLLRDFLSRSRAYKFRRRRCVQRLDAVPGNMYTRAAVKHGRGPGGSRVFIAS